MVKGSIPALITPMTLEGHIDWDGLADLIEWHIEQKSDAICVVGTTGESPTVTPEEHIKIIAFTVDQVRGRVPVIAGSGANSTQEAIDLTQAAKDAKADASLSVVPYYNKPGQTGLYQHFVALATSVNIPIILYDVPSRTGIELATETVAKLATLDNIIGIKDATGNMDKVKSLRSACGDDFILLSGDDGTFMDFLTLGGVGTISVTANLAPKDMQRICALARTLAHTLAHTNIEAARAINDKLEPLHKSLFVEANPIPVKYALYKMGKIKPAIRLPLTWANDDTQKAIDTALQASGLIL